MYGHTDHIACKMDTGWLLFQEERNLHTAHTIVFALPVMDGIVCEATAEALAAEILKLADNPQKLAELKHASLIRKQVDNVKEIAKLEVLLTS